MGLALCRTHIRQVRQTEDRALPEDCKVQKPFTGRQRPLILWVLLLVAHIAVAVSLAVPAARPGVSCRTTIGTSIQAGLMCHVGGETSIQSTARRSSAYLTR